MAKISIIGAAGTLGAAIAFRLVEQENITELCLIDINESVLLNHLMDLQNAFPHKRLYKGNYPDVTGSDIVIITAGVPNRNDISSRNAFLKDNLKLFKQFGENIQEYAPHALIVTASNPVDILNFYLYDSFSFKPHQLIGYTMNDSFRFEWALRDVLELYNEESIETPVLGEHGSSQVPIFSKVKKNGERWEIPVDTQREIEEKLKSWFIDFNRLKVNRTTGWTTAVGMGKVIERVLSTEKSSMIGSAILSGQYGITDVSLGAPLIVNNKGIKEIEEWDVTEEELHKYRQSAQVVRDMV